MAFCTNCGAQLPDGTKFCTGCGQKLEAKAAEVSAAPEREAPAQPVQQEHPKQAEAPAQGAYQASYTPPAQQQSYTPPVQQSAQPQSYTPPVQQSAPQQSYSAPNAAASSAYSQPAYAPAPNGKAPKQKKPMNKKTLFIIGGAALVVILAVVLIIVLGGKGGDKAVASSDPNVGLYTAVTAEMMGMEVDIADIWPGGFTIELMDKGKCSIEIDGQKASGKWTLDGDAFHIKGGGVDCNGTLSGGKISLEDVLSMGITLNFTKAAGTSAQSGDSAVPGEAGAANALQTQWNGTWYGCLYVSEATGTFAGIPSDRYDAYMVVDVDASGKGQFAVYLDGVEEAFALANCEAKEAGLYAVDGTVAGGVEMYAYNWMFLPMPDYPDQYGMGDTIKDGDDLFDFTLFMKQWGGSWQKEIDSNFAITPPSVEWYNGAIERGEVPPVGFSPIGYEGSGSTPQGGGEMSGPTDILSLEDEIFVTYPTDTFAIDESAIWDTLQAKDGSVKITMVARFDGDDNAAMMERLSSYSSNDEYTTSDFTTATGFKGRIVTYYDDFFGYGADAYVDFGGQNERYNGLSFSMTSEESLEACTSSEVIAIIENIAIANSAPTDTSEPAAPTGGDYGSSAADADGIVALDNLIAAVKYCNEHRGDVSYEDVYRMMGNVNGVAYVDKDIWKPGEVHSYGWSAASGEFSNITFSVTDSGEFWKSMSSTPGLKDR